MDIPWVRFVSQSGVYLTFALCLAWAARRGARDWAPLVSACLYAVLFEHWNMMRYAQVQGGYHYNTASWVWVWGDVPLYIPLAWAFILATSRALTDRLRLPPWARPFSDALLALLIDASMDAVAIRLGFWYWHGVRLNEGFFGVPADNFVGWLLVSFTFSALTRWLWSDRPGGNGAAISSTNDTAGDFTFNVADPGSASPPESGGRGSKALGALPEFAGSLTASKNRAIGKAAAQIIVLPPIAYLAYLGLEAIVHLQYRLFHAETLRGQLFVLAGTIFLFAAVVIAGLSRSDKDRGADGGNVVSKRPGNALVHGPRQLFHLFGPIGLLFVPAALRAPALWALAGGVWALEWSIALFAAKVSRRTKGI